MLGLLRREAARIAAGGSRLVWLFFHLGLSLERMCGFTPNAGPHGETRDSTKPLQHYRRWASDIEDLAKINVRLCAIGGFDPDEWDFPPKPKWMRWRTYNSAEEKFDRYEAILDEGMFEVIARFLGHG